METLSINMGIVQASGLGPTLYIVMASDFKPLSTNNILFKFADDTTLLVPENTDVDLAVEFQHFRCLAADNHMIINLVKTKEIVFSSTICLLILTVMFNRNRTCGVR